MTDTPTTLARKLAQLTPDRRERIQARGARLIAEELTLRDLRKALDVTQAQLAKRLGVGQDTVSRYERRTDMLLSTLQGYVRAMGGELDLLASFPDRPPMKIRSLGEVSASRSASPSPGPRGSLAARAGEIAVDIHFDARLPPRAAADAISHSLGMARATPRLAA